MGTKHKSAPWNGFCLWVAIILVGKDSSTQLDNTGFNLDHGMIKEKVIKHFLVTEV